MCGDVINGRYEYHNGKADEADIASGELSAMKKIKAAERRT